MPKPERLQKKVNATFERVHAEFLISVLDQITIKGSQAEWVVEIRKALNKSLTSETDGEK